MTALYIVIAILLFGVLIIVHELGHFAAAKLFGVRVEEFSVGMGPAILQSTQGETTYSLRCIPFGGYCAMTGEDEKLDDPRAFTSQSPLKRVIILCAGAFMNFLLGFIIVFFLYSDAEAFRAPIIVDFMDGCPYESADGFQKGDEIISIDGHRIYQQTDVGDFLSNGQEYHDIVVRRDGKRVRLDNMKLVPTEYEGYENKMYGFYFGIKEASFGEKLRQSWFTCLEFGRWVWQGLRELVSGNVGMKDMAGPVGIVDMMAETGEQAQSVRDGIFDVLYFGAFIAVNLAIMNLLPIPAVDGGRVFLLIVTLMIEAITKKKLDPKYEGYIHAAGMVLLLALMGVIMLNDIVRIVRK